MTGFASSVPWEHLSAPTAESALASAVTDFVDTFAW